MFTQKFATVFAVMAMVFATLSFAAPANAQHYNQGGVIPCSADDYRFVQGQRGGWRSNCQQPRRQYQQRTYQRQHYQQHRTYQQQPVRAAAPAVASCGNFCAQVSDVCRTGFRLVAAPPSVSRSGFFCVPN